MTWSAPGKMLLLGDYAVLDGAEAMVAAVDRRAVGACTPNAPEPSEVVAAVLARAKKEGFQPPAGISIDTASFHDDTGTKLGLGSSASVAVVTAALAADRGDEITLRIALDGHRAAAGGKGSGVDVAASFYGGVIATGPQPAPVEPLPSKLRGLHFSVLFTGEAASTPKLVTACTRSARWPHWSAVLRDLAAQGVTAYKKQEAQRFLSIVARYGRAMAGMGKDAGVDVVTEPIDAAMRIASELGAAAKPSGAGGGDVIVMWAPRKEIADQVANRSNLMRVDLQIDRRGLARESG